MPAGPPPLPPNRFNVAGTTTIDASRRTIIRTTYQLAGRLKPTEPSETNVEQFHNAQIMILNWIKKLTPLAIPMSAYSGDSFDRDSPGHRLEVINIQERNIWCARFEHPDVGLGESIPAVAGRAWRTDISISKEGKNIYFGIRISCSTRADVNAEIPLVRPRIIRDFASSFNLISALPVDGLALPVSTNSELNQLKDFIENPLRQLPVVVLTNPSIRDRELVVSDWVLDPEKLAKRYLGWAHVVLIPDDLTFSWSDLVGRSWGVYHGAVRIYKPGLEFSNQSPFSHPLFTLERILDTDLVPDLVSRTNGVSKGFEARLESVVTESAVARPRDFSRTPFVPEAQGIVAELERKRIIETAPIAAGTSAIEQQWKARFDLLLDQVEAERASYKKQAEEWEQKVDEYFAQAVNYEEERDRIKQEANGMKWQITELTTALRINGDKALDIPIPDDYDSMPEWVQKYLSGRLRLHPRAERSLKSGIYEDVELVYKSLLLLGNSYQPMKIGQPGAKELWEQGLADLDLSFGGSIDRARAHEEGDDYFVRWPLLSPSLPKRFLEYHLRKGSSHDPRYCLGIYFFWDEDQFEVVVGSLPAHLNNRFT